MIELMYTLKIFFRKFLFKFKSVRVEDISDDYILINPHEIVDFMNNCEGMLEIVNDSLPLIKRHFPDCPIYLAYDDYEGNEDIYAIIISKDRSFEENFELHDALLDDSIILKTIIQMLILISSCSSRILMIIMKSGGWKS